MIPLLNRSGLFDRRVHLMVLVGLVYLLPCICSLWLGPEWYKWLWSWLGVPVMLPIFADLRGVTAPLECFEDVGFEVYEKNRCDPWRRPFNYPRVWLLLYYIGVRQSHTELIGFVLLFFFFCALLSLLHLIKRPYLPLVFPLFISPPIALIVERANNDLIIFLLLVGAAFTSSRSQLLSGALLLGSAILKLYPVFAFVALLRTPRLKSNVVLFGITLSCFVAYALYFFEDLSRIDQATASPRKLAYGFTLFVEGVFLPAVSAVGLSLSYATVRILFALTLAGTFFAGWRRVCVPFAPMTGPSSGTALFAFQAGAAVFIGTYLMDSHYYYRLVFLLLCLPYLFSLVESEQRSYRLMARACIMILILQFWGEYFPFTRRYSLDEWGNLFGALFLAYFLGVGAAFQRFSIAIPRSIAL